MDNKFLINKSGAFQPWSLYTCTCNHIFTHCRDAMKWLALWFEPLTQKIRSVQGGGFHMTGVFNPFLCHQIRRSVHHLYSQQFRQIPQKVTILSETKSDKIVTQIITKYGDIFITSIVTNSGNSWPSSSTRWRACPPPLVSRWLTSGSFSAFAEIIKMSRRSQVPTIANVDETNENIVGIW